MSKSAALGVVFVVTMMLCAMFGLIGRTNALESRLDHLPPVQYVIHAEDDPLPCKVQRNGIKNVNGVLVAWCKRGNND